MSAAPEGARAKLLAYALSTVSHYHTNNEVFLMIMREHNQINPQMIAKFTDRYQERLSLVSRSLQTAMLSGMILASDPQTLATLFDGMIRTYVMAASQGLWPSSGESPTDVAELMVSVFFDGIASKQNQG